MTMVIWPCVKIKMRRIRIWNILFQNLNLSHDHWNIFVYWRERRRRWSLQIVEDRFWRLCHILQIPERSIKDFTQFCSEVWRSHRTGCSWRLEGASMIVLDTHAWIWWVSSPEFLSEKAKTNNWWVSNWQEYFYFFHQHLGGCYSCFAGQA